MIILIERALRGLMTKTARSFHLKLAYFRCSGFCNLSVQPAEARFLGDLSGIGSAGHYTDECNEDRTTLASRTHIGNR